MFKEAQQTGAIEKNKQKQTNVEAKVKKFATQQKPVGTYTSPLSTPKQQNIILACTVETYSLLNTQCKS